jgi:hypothetical protein
MDHHCGGARFRSISTCQSTDWHVLLLAILTYGRQLRPSGGQSSCATNANTPVGSIGRTAAIVDFRLFLVILVWIVLFFR